MNRLDGMYADVKAERGALTALSCRTHAGQPIKPHLILVLLNGGEEP